jgi:2-polyprenyl-3-methyl-5-hydroxy-6-metoxy-1,4-benzoquinol methylase
MKQYKRPYFEIANPEIPNLLRDLPGALNVLDVGCGSGVHGAELKRIHGHRVVGVDLSESSVQKAKTRLAEAYIADVTKPELYPFSGARKFDLILFSDVLEHLYDPLDVLTRHYPLLAPGGKVVISLPNIAVWNIRLGLLAGRFEYQDTGTLDRTHVRFYTRRTFRRFAAEAGLDIQRSRITPGILRPFVPLIKKVYGHGNSEPDSSSIMESGPYGFYMKWCWPVESAVCRAWPGLLAFTFMALAEPVGHAIGQPGSKEYQEQEQPV